MAYCSLAGEPVLPQTQAVFPEYKLKFKSKPVKEIMETVLKERLEGVEYNAEESPLLTKRIAGEIKDRLLDLEVPRYKIMVNVILGEQRRQGIRLGRRCFWDGNTDSLANETFTNGSLFCIATAYAVYLY
ncbi:Tctex2-related light chain [Besnoitia besnoiti]|uniref:Tctex2-related light chain n=1 Tax=Besnoitia besnoiti TaxID=94643 RepID=A0A2A9M243_BESBE|nr:Tctex2-related light chain [Besnoitia besnoiti]PFH31314.1 Tctex2-related light chain [Besnoitia besnoiti]